jgi:hypothetical protein
LETTKRMTFRGSYPVDHPGWWMLEASAAGESETRSIIRKPDGTYRQIASIDLFPRSGGTLHIELGDQVTDAKSLAQCREYYAQFKEKQAEHIVKEGQNRSPMNHGSICNDKS